MKSNSNLNFFLWLWNHKILSSLFILGYLSVKCCAFSFTECSLTEDSCGFPHATVKENIINLSVLTFLNNLKSLHFFFSLSSKTVFYSSQFVGVFYETFERWEANEKLKSL